MTAPDPRRRLAFALDYPSLAEARAGASAVHDAVGVLKVGLELLKVVTAHKRWMDTHLGMKADRCYALVRDYLKGVKEVMGEIWGNNERYTFTRDVTLKALIRVLDDLIVDRKLMSDWEQQRSPKPFADLLKPWEKLVKEFRSDGFYERFPAKGQLERVRRIHQRLLDSLMKLGA